MLWCGSGLCSICGYFYFFCIFLYYLLDIIETNDYIVTMMRVKTNNINREGNMKKETAEKIEQNENVYVDAETEMYNRDSRDAEYGTG